MLWNETMNKLYTVALVQVYEKKHEAWCMYRRIE